MNIMSISPARMSNVLRTWIGKIRENGFELKKKRSRRYPAKTITDAAYAEDIALLANTPYQAETLLHSLERAAAGIGLHVNAHKTWTAIDKLSVIWKPDLTDKRKRCFFQAAVVSIWMHHLDAHKTAREEGRRQLHKNVASNIKQVLAATLHKAPTIRPPASHHENYPSLTNQARKTLLEEQGRAHKWCTPMDPHISTS